MTREKISIIVPTYNEKDNILPLTKEIHDILKNIQHEIIIIDDNSPDNTYTTVKHADLSYIKIFIRKETPSLASSIRLGIEKSEGSILIIMDSDFNHQPKYLPFLIENLKYYDCISASRFLYGGNMESRLRQVLSWIFNVFIRFITGGRITDNLYGYFSIRKKTLFQYDFDSIFWGYGDYYMRLLYYMQKDGANILEFPAINGIRPTGTSNQRYCKTFFKYFIAAMELAYIKRSKK